MMTQMKCFFRFFQEDEERPDYPIISTQFLVHYEMLQDSVPKIAPLEGLYISTLSIHFPSF